MTCLATEPEVSDEPIESLARLHQLGLEAGLSESPKQLIFRILNRSIICCRYDRAVLWSLTGIRPKILGVSGSMDYSAESPVASEWRRVVTAMANRSVPMIVGRGTCGADEATWTSLAQRTKGLSVVWLPITVAGKGVGGLWLERWGTDSFASNELARLETLALTYGVAWKGVFRRRSRLVEHLVSRKGAAAAGIAVLLLLAACFIRVPLRIVAPCEVVASDPIAITAPLTGVIDEIPVLPGRTAKKGDLLAVYDKRVAIEEMEVAGEQMKIVASDLRRSRVQAFDDPSARAAIALLENRLEQEKIRLQAAVHRVDRLEVRAPIQGTLMFDNPHEWRGRPVQVGQRLMMIVDPSNTKLRIWLPDSDNIDFDRDMALTVILDHDPRSSRPARLRFLASHSQIGRNGKPCFRAEADWVNPETRVKMGLQGTVVLYGQRVTLAYWLLRRPLAAIRKHVGI